MSEEITNNQQQQQQELLLEEKKSELNQLTLEIEKLSKFKSVIQAQHTSSRHSPDQVSSYEELDDLRVECKQLVTRKHSLESELEDYKGEISQLRRKLEEGVDVPSLTIPGPKRIQ